MTAATVNRGVLLAEGYFIEQVGPAEWAWGLHDEIWADGYANPDLAWADAAEHRESLQPVPCERCGDQFACPDCVGG